MLNAAPRGTLRVTWKQNSLFLLGVLIKCLFNTSSSNFLGLLIVHPPGFLIELDANRFASFIFVFSRDRIYALQRQKERLEEQVDLANKALAESAIKPKK